MSCDGRPDLLGYRAQETSHDHGLVDRTTTQLEDTLGSAGYDVGSEIEYVGEADNVASNRTVTTALAVLGFLIVAISMVGFANAITMSVIERTREVGVLRTIRPRARDVRRIFATDAREPGPCAHRHRAPRARDHAPADRRAAGYRPGDACLRSSRAWRPTEFRRADRAGYVVPPGALRADPDDRAGRRTDDEGANDLSDAIKG
jgi:hypothetical protein